MTVDDLQKEDARRSSSVSSEGQSARPQLWEQVDCIETSTAREDTQQRRAGARRLVQRRRSVRKYVVVVTGDVAARSGWLRQDLPGCGRLSPVLREEETACRTLLSLETTAFWS